MSKGWLIYSKKDIDVNQSYINWFIKEASYQSIQLELIIREDITAGIINNARTVRVNGFPITKPEFAIVRTIDPLLSLHLEACDITVFNSSSISRICNDKALTHHRMHNLRIPMVDTLYSKKQYLTDTPPLAYPFIIKETAGRGGKQVFLIENDQQYTSISQVLANTELIVQPSTVEHGKDIRVFIVGKEIIAAVKRENDKDFRANFKLGGSASLYDLSDKERSMIQSIVNHFDFGMVGIDFLISYNGELLFNEIEDIVGSRTLSKVSDINILRTYMTYIRRKISNNID
nr:ATP-grasp domain-containing protein [Priestia megaterium]